MAQLILDLFQTFTNCLFCFPSTPTLRINNRSFRLLRLLGEGGFSYVYLVQDTSDSSLYALKKIRCPFGQESVAQALKEVEAYSLFSDTPDGRRYIIHSIDHQVKDEGGKVSGIGNEGGTGGQQKTVYILLPYYRKGNLQDAINANLVNHTKFSEKRLMRIMLGVCKALKCMHQYQVPGSTGTSAASRAARKARSVRQEAAAADADLANHYDGEEGGDASQALMPDNTGSEITASQASRRPGEIHAYAHRDIKPANIMLEDSDDSSNPEMPILMDLGSIAVSPTPITNRSIALAVQDTAAEHSTMPYRAPELFDVKTGSTIDTKVDIWSLGCTIYACLIGKSPFEARSDETGGSLSICILGGDWRWPDANQMKKPVRQGTVVEQPQPQTQQRENGTVESDMTTNANRSQPVYPSAGVRELVKRCLTVEPIDRPDVDAVIALIEDIIKNLPVENTSYDS